MPTYKIILRNHSDPSHNDPGPGRVKQALHIADSAEQAESALLYEIQRICSDPHTHYSWTITEVQS